jgi:hypothetical protein
MTGRGRILIATLTGAVLALGFGAPAAAIAATGDAQQAGGHIEGPHRAPAVPFDVPAGQSCDFGVHLEPVVDKIMAIDYYDASGRLAKSFFYGTLIDDVTNTETGATTRVDLSGKALFVYGVDGSLTIYGAGPYEVTLHPGDEPGPGIMLVDGISKVVIGADHHRRIVYASSVENLCDRID